MAGTQMNKHDLPGYRGNELVNQWSRCANMDYVFIPDDGCWCFSKEDALKMQRLTGNEVGCHYVELEYFGYTLYRHAHTNVWD